MKSINVLIVEDHLITLVGLKMVLQQWPTIAVVGEAQNGLEALELIETLAPDVVLLDVGLPDIDGIECLSRIKKNGWPSRILMRSSHEEVDVIMAAMAAGADGYCFKDSSDSLLIEALELMANGKAWIHPRVANQLLRFFNTPGRGQHFARRAPSAQLDSQDLALLTAIARGDCGSAPEGLRDLLRKFESE